MDITIVIKNVPVGDGKSFYEFDFVRILISQSVVASTLVAKIVAGAQVLDEKRDIWDKTV